MCTWCGKPPSEVPKLVAGPNIYICDGCVRDAERTLKKAGAKPASRTTRCSFCRRFAGKSRPVVTGPHAKVCDACLRLCRDFMALGAS